MTSLLPLVLSALVLSGSAGPAPGRVVWTVDDGPHRVNTAPLLRLFDRYGIRAVWFVSGYQLAFLHGPEQLREIVRRGHLIGNHLWTHKSPCNALTVPEVLQELQRTDRRMRRILSGPWARYRSQLRRWYRPPYGHQCKRVNAAVRNAGYSVWMWHVSNTDRLRGVAATIVWRRKRGMPTIVLWHHRWRKLRDLLRLLERYGQVVRRKPVRHER